MIVRDGATGTGFIAIVIQYIPVTVRLSCTVQKERKPSERTNSKQAHLKYQNVW
jgi:hypothetical protein